MKKHHKAHTFKFTRKTHSKKGIVGLVLAILSILAGIVLIAISFVSNGNGTVYLGSGGILSMLVSLLSFVLAGQGLREENSYKLFPAAALFFALVSLAGWIAIYMLGLLEYV